MYPSVEYDFVPNSLALNTNDMVHFQWTGSDYNPRRGCNDATGGPPDLNTYFTDATANQNPRADRSNVVFTYHMGNNVPKDYTGYHVADNLTYSEKLPIANATVLENVPCYEEGHSHDIAQACYESVMRLAYLSQQTDSGSLLLREGNNCMTTTELDTYLDQDIADFHPLNCAKLNAKPYSYFDGGVMIMRKSGWFPYFSSRNNNFSNRQQIGIICVGSNCTLDANTVLQDVNPNTNNALTKTANARTTSTCYDTANGQNGANSNGVTSCLPKSATKQTPENVIQGETFATQEGDNDMKGDGNPTGCAVLTYSDSSNNSVENNVALAIGLLFVGLFCSWLSYYLYNRYQARLEGESKFRYETAWQKASAPDRKERPASGAFSEANPGIKMARSITRADSNKAMAAGAGAGGAAAEATAVPASPTPALARQASTGASPSRATSAGRTASAKAIPIARPASSTKVNRRYEMI